MKFGAKEIFLAMGVMPLGKQFLLLPVSHAPEDVTAVQQIVRKIVVNLVLNWVEPMLPNKVVGPVLIAAVKPALQLLLLRLLVSQPHRLHPLYAFILKAPQALA